MALQIEENKAEVFTLTQLQVYGMQHWARSGSHGSQPTLDKFFMKEVVRITPESYGLCYPGHALIRHFILTVADATSIYKFSWRQQNVACRIASIDATFKRFMSVLFPVRQTVWSIDMNAPAISINLSTASLNASPLVDACKTFNEVVRATGMQPIALMYLDNPRRDGDGALSLFPSLNTGAATELTFPMIRCITVHAVEQLSAALLAFSNTQVVALDLEWTASQRKGVPPGKVALLQLFPVSSAEDQDGGGSCVVVSLSAIGYFPEELATFLAEKKLAGVNISADLTKLHKDFPVTTCILQQNLVELTSLAVDKFRCLPSTVKSLKGLFEHCYSAKTLNKNLCYEKGVRFVNWDKWPLSQNELQYAANDVYGHALIAHRLLRPSPVALHLHPPVNSVAPLLRGPPSAAALASKPGVVFPVVAEGLAEAGQAPTLVAVSVSNSTLNGAALFDQLPTETQLELLPSLVLPANGVDYDSLDAESMLNSSSDPTIGADQSVKVAHKSVLQASVAMLDAFACSEELGPMVFPAFLTKSDRVVLHDLAEARGLQHTSIGDNDSRQLQVRKTSLTQSGGKVNRSSLPLTCDSDAQILSQLIFNSNWNALAIKYDPRHFMGNVFLLAQSKSSPLFAYFCTAVSDAMFKMQTGERARVELHLRQVFNEIPSDPNDKLRVTSLITRVKRSYWRSYCRFSIPEPATLVRDLLAVYNFFKDLVCPESGRPFFASDHDKRIVLELSYVAHGYLSDHPTIELYALSRKLTTGLQTFHCLRTSSAQEGYHLHLYNAVSACGKHAGLRYTDATTNEFDWRWTIKALRKAGVIPNWTRHFNVALIDELYDLVENLFSTGAAAVHLPGWRRTKFMNAPLLRHGIYFALDSMRKTLAPQAPVINLKLATSASEADFLSQILGKPSIRLLRNADDTAALIAAFQADPTTVAAVAFSRGLLLSPTEASSFGEVVELAEKTRLSLVDAGHKTLQDQIRVLAPIRGIATLPAIGTRSVGSLDLPGPHITMPPMERAPAFRQLQLAAPTATASALTATAEHANAAPLLGLGAKINHKRKQVDERARQKDQGKLY